MPIKGATMPKFFLHLHEGDQFIEDLEGTIFPDSNSARVEAEEAAREMLADRVRQGREVDGQRIEIVDEDGSSVATIRFRDQLKLRPDAVEQPRKDS